PQTRCSNVSHPPTVGFHPTRRALYNLPERSPFPLLSTPKRYITARLYLRDPNHVVGPAETSSPLFHRTPQPLLSLGPPPDPSPVATRRAKTPRRVGADAIDRAHRRRLGVGYPPTRGEREEENRGRAQKRAGHVGHRCVYECGKTRDDGESAGDVMISSYSPLNVT
ncbi:hypothetical protein GWI33_011348, partial [Rhynchophorus ferrugineus]